jgi:tetratricopeptide (TPR) repeat protein
MSEAAERLLEAGRREQRAGFRARAARLYRRVPTDDDCFPNALTLLGRVRFEQGWAAEAIQILTQSLERRGDQSDAWEHLGDAFRHTNHLDAATACYRRALTLSPARADCFGSLCATTGVRPPFRFSTKHALKRAVILAPFDQASAFELGTQLWRDGELSAAAGWFRRILLRTPSDTGALFRLGNVTRDLDQIDDADTLYRRSLSLVPGAHNILNNRGLLAFGRADWNTAEALFADARTANPEMAVAWANQARALQKLGRDDAAAEAYKHALALSPVDLEALCEIGNLIEDATWIRRARIIDPFAPQPYTELALAAARTESRAGVKDWLRRVAVLKPDDGEIWNRLCINVGRDGDAETAAIYGAFATYVNDHHPTAHLDRALALLALERFEEGWRIHRRRLEAPQAASLKRIFAIPEWTDQNIAGRHVLLWSEQGIGDEVQFLTLAGHLEHLGASLTILAEPRLGPILKRSFPRARIPDAHLPTGQIEDHHGADLHLALGDLPDRLGLFCGGDARPAPWIVPDASRVTVLRSALKDRHTGKRLIGITWRSIAPQTGGRRSIPPQLWRPLANVPDIAVVSLQYGAVKEDGASFESDAGVHLDLEHGIEPFEDLDGLAALVAAVDLVICPANNTVHFAGALAKPCWTLLPTKPDWRWGLTRSDSLWYPQTTVYRQEKPDDWTSVMQRVAADLTVWSDQRI